MTFVIISVFHTFSFYARNIHDGFNPISEVAGGDRAEGHAGVRPSSGAATGFIRATEHFPTARLSHLAAAGAAALR